jgi:hypothetical protein
MNVLSFLQRPVWNLAKGLAVETDDFDGDDEDNAGDDDDDQHKFAVRITFLLGTHHGLAYIAVNRHLQEPKAAARVSAAEEETTTAEPSSAEDAAVEDDEDLT